MTNKTFSLPCVRRQVTVISDIRPIIIDFMMHVMFVFLKLTRCDGKCRKEKCYETPKELRNYNRKLFCVHHKNLSFFMIKNNTLAHQINYVHQEKWIYFLQTVFIWSSFLWKTKEDSHGSKYNTSVLICLEKRHKPSRVATAKNFVYVISMDVFIPWDNWKTQFFIRVYRCPKLLFKRHVLAFYEASDLNEYHEALICLLNVLN